MPQVDQLSSRVAQAYKLQSAQPSPKGRLVRQVPRQTSEALNLEEEAKGSPMNDTFRYDELEFVLSTNEANVRQRQL